MVMVTGGWIQTRRFSRASHHVSAGVFCLIKSVELIVLITSFPNLIAQDWTVTDVQVVENQAITLTGDLVVKDGGSLTLRGVTLQVGKEHGIRLETGRSLFIYDDSHILATDLESSFPYFTVEGTAFELIDSRLEGCPSLRINTDGATIQGNVFSFSPNVMNIQASNTSRIRQWWEYLESDGFPSGSGTSGSTSI